MYFTIYCNAVDLKGHCPRCPACIFTVTWTRCRSTLHTFSLKRSAAYGQGVVHPDDAAVQDGRREGRDFEHLSVPRVGAPGRNVVPSHVGHHVPDGLRFPARQVRLGLENGSFGDYQPGGTILYFCVDWDSFS